MDIYRTEFGESDVNNMYAVKLSDLLHVADYVDGYFAYIHAIDEKFPVIDLFSEVTVRKSPTDIILVNRTIYEYMRKVLDKKNEP